MEPMTTLIGPSVLDPSLCISDLKTKRKSSVVQELIARAHETGAVRDAVLLRETVLLRERWCVTAVGKGVAVPNARSIAIEQPRIVIGRSRKGIDWDAPDGQPVQVVLLVLSPAEATEEAHTDRVVRATALTRQQRNRARLLDAVDASDVAELFHSS